MPFIELIGKTFEVNEDGFLVNPQEWNEELAKALAKEADGIETLSQQQWAVIQFIRNYYLENKMAPMVRSICKTTGFPLRQIYEMFPSGPAKGACRIAGLPKPDGCV